MSTTTTTTTTTTMTRTTMTTTTTTTTTTELPQFSSQERTSDRAVGGFFFRIF
jgi:hypothetical protein